MRPKPVAGKALSEDKMTELMGHFTALMTESKLFKDPSVSVGMVAERLDTNRTYLSKTINDTMGKSFTQLINDYRIREAISLISDTKSNLPLKQICADAGFSSMSTFYTTFQTVTGMTPSRYRAQVDRTE
ncbi:MAG: helix-turn-helix domain-containing protein [Bacteroides sp.]|nr:helix-turn-helix domain-containing protein [Bacteroides sp.]